MSDCPEKQTATVTLYAIQNCGHCKDTKEYLRDRDIAFNTVYVDMLVGAERNDTMRLLKRINPAVSFPTLQVDEETIVGFKPKRIQTALQGLLKPTR